MTQETALESEEKDKEEEILVKNSSLWVHTHVFLSPLLLRCSFVALGTESALFYGAFWEIKMWVSN